MSRVLAKLHDFKPLTPRFERSQDSALDWLMQAHVQAQSSLPDFDRALWEERMRKLVRRFSCGSDRIGSRGHELEDFTHQDWGRMRIFSLAEGGSGQGAGMRTEFFGEVVDQAFERLYSDAPAKEPPCSLIHVTCTGYVSPSGAQKLVARRGWHEQTTVTHAYHMGCYAAIPATRLAAEAAARGRVDVVHTELCTIHLDPSQHTPEQLVIQSLFADGMIRYSASAGDATKRGLDVLATREDIVPGSIDAMSWAAGALGMEMTLSREVPELIRDQLPRALELLFRDASLEYGRDGAACVYAVHPGGPKIIDAVAELLGLREDQIPHSRKILRERGNMSSATLPFIWKEILDDARVLAGTRVVSMAFGPGLTLATALLVKA